MSFPLLDAMLAFALTMLGVATTTNILLSVVRRICGRRQSIMKNMLKTFFSARLEAIIASEFRKLNVTAPANASGIGRDGLGNERDEVASQLKSFINDTKIDTVDAASLVDYIRASELGQHLQAVLGASMDDHIARISKSFDEFGAAMTRKFEDYSRLWSFLWAIVIAFVINVNSIDILKTYLTSDAARQAVIAQQELIVKRYETQQKTPSGDSGSNEASENIDTAIDKTKKEIKALQSAALPVGWQRFPYCMSGDAAGQDSRCTLADWPANLWELLKHLGANFRGSPATFFSWIFGCVLTGLLAGLGAPFWYDTVTGLSKVTRGLGQTRRNS